MKREDLLRAFGEISERTLLEAETEGRKRAPRRGVRRWVMAAAAVAVCASISGTAFAIGRQSAGREHAELYIRYLSPENLELEGLSGEEPFQAEPFFEALKSDDPKVQYVALNRLAECYNDPALRARALEAVRPFLTSGEEKLAQAAALTTDLLSETFRGENFCRLADGGVYFTLFYQYSDYGSGNVIFRILDGRMEQYFAFDAPSDYILEMTPSPDGRLLAVRTGSNKSEFLTVFDPVGGTVSPELVTSARMLHAADAGRDLTVRVDGETYSETEEPTWLDGDTLQFEGTFAYRGGEEVDKATVCYHFEERRFEIQAE